MMRAWTWRGARAVQGAAAAWPGWARRVRLPGVPRVLLFAIAAWALTAPGLAAEEGQRVVAVDVRGTKTIARETILSKVEMRPGLPYQDAIVSEDIRRLFALGYFTDVRADTEPSEGGIRLIFTVAEKPTISSVQADGTRTMSKDRVRDLLDLEPGELYDPRRLSEGIALVKAEYARRGFGQAEVASQVTVQEATNGAAILLLVDEGPRMRIVRVLVEGNQAFADGRIRKLMKTKAKRWFTSGVYDEQVLDEDLERVRAFYRKQGYQDVEASSKVYTDPAGRGLYVHLTVAEGIQHRVGEVRTEGVTLFPEREILHVISLKPGAIYSTETLHEDLRLVKQYYGDRGYINAEITPDPQLDAGTKRVNVVYHVAERELVHVNRVEIRGNLRTRDVVIRRELRIHPGEVFNGARIRRSLDRLYNLGFFEEVNVETEPTDRPDRQDLVMQVKEAKTGSFSFGGGFSSVDRLVGLIELEQRNFDWRNVPTFTGAGQDLRVRAEVGTVRRYFDLSFTEPWILGRPVSFGVDLYNRTRLRSSNLGLGYEEEQRGIGFRLGREFSDLFRGGLSYQLYRTEISDVVAEASADLKAEEGENTISVVGTTLSVDTRDNRFDPTAGSYAFISGDLAGGIFGGDKDFYRIQAGGSHYVPHARDLVFEVRIRSGLVTEYDDTADVPIFERFFGGGAGTIRGFRERGVGPRDPISNDPIGGEAMLVGTLEEVLTIIKDERGRPILKGSGFLDVGNVWRRLDQFATSFKAGAGVGTRVNTPIGPLRLDLGVPVSDTDDEKRKPRFHFNISRSF